MRTSWIIFFLVYTVGASTLFAERPYGPAGCGLGFRVFKKEAQIFAASTNAVSFNQSFGISFGTSGCTQNGIIKKEAYLSFFLEINQTSLMNEIAKGHGDSLKAMSDLFQCQDPEFFAKMLKKNYGVIFPRQANTFRYQATQVCSILAQTRPLSDQCNRQIRSQYCSGS